MTPLREGDLVEVTDGLSRGVVATAIRLTYRRTEEKPPLDMWLVRLPDGLDRIIRHDFLRRIRGA